jgi:hypothetical protein
MILVFLGNDHAKTSEDPGAEENRYEEIHEISAQEKNDEKGCKRRSHKESYCDRGY